MPNQEFDNTNKGALFINKDKSKEKPETAKWADMQGNINIEGVEYWLSGWSKVIGQGEKAGQKMLSVSVKKKENQPAPKSPYDLSPQEQQMITPQGGGQSGVDDGPDLPF